MHADTDTRACGHVDMRAYAHTTTFVDFLLTLSSGGGVESGVAVSISPYQTYTFEVWSGAIANGTCR